MSDRSWLREIKLDLAAIEERGRRRAEEWERDFLSSVFNAPPGCVAHARCTCCGAPNQYGVCKYCGVPVNQIVSGKAG